MTASRHRDTRSIPMVHTRLMPWLAFVVLAQVIPLSRSQTIGVDICACSPSVYTFQLNFSLTCAMETVKDNPGVSDAECRVSGVRAGLNVTDVIPVKVSTFEILELNANNEVIQSGFYDQGYFDGATISYTSITGRPDALNLTVDQVPRGLQINIIGQNANEEDILNYWIVLFTNQCNAFPVFEIGDMIGWTVIRGLANPLSFFCPPASEAPSSSPAPSASLMPSPTILPTTPCIPKNVTTNEPTVNGPTHGKGKGSRMLRELKVWNDDKIYTPAPTACIEPSPTSTSKKSSKKGQSPKNSKKKGTKKKDTSKSSPSKSKIHHSKESKVTVSSKSKPKSKHKAVSKESNKKAQSTSSKSQYSKRKEIESSKSLSKVHAPSHEPAGANTSPFAPPPTPTSGPTPPGTSTVPALPPPSPPSTSAGPSPNVAESPSSTAVPTSVPTRWPTPEPTQVSA